MKNRLLIVILACLSMLGAFSTDTYLPSFPSIATEFQIGLDAVQQTLTVYLLAMAVMTSLPRHPIRFSWSPTGDFGRTGLVRGGIDGRVLRGKLFVPAPLPPGPGLPVAGGAV